MVFSGGVGGVEPGWAVQLLSINKVKGESSISVNEKSLSPLKATTSPELTLPSNSNKSKLTSSCISVYLNVTIASLFDDTQAFPIQSPEIFDWA